MGKRKYKKVVLCGFGFGFAGLGFGRFGDLRIRSSWLGVTSAVAMRKLVEENRRTEERQ